MKRLSRDLLACGLGAWLVLSPTTAGAQSTTPDPTTAGPTEPASDSAASPAPEPSAAPAADTTPSAAAPSPDAAPPTTPASTRQTQASTAEDEQDDPAAPEDEDEPTLLDVDDAVLRWGVNNESNTRAFAPGTYNFMSAGKLGNPGQGVQALAARGDGSTWTNGRRAGWSATSGAVSLEKWDGSAYRRATFAGTSTDTTGKQLASGTFSGHQLVFADGEGTIDLEARTAEVRWDGDATILYYSGYSFFYLSDPVLSVADGTGRVTAELSGYASSMEDMSKWEPVAPRRVTVADLGKVELDADGFTATPAYDGVRVSGKDVAQVAPYGSFPQSFVDYQAAAGTAAYWYSSGGSADPHKKALPMTFAWAGNPAAPPAPPSTGSTPEPIVNTALTPPGASNLAAPNVPVPAPNLFAAAVPVTAAAAVGTSDLLHARPVASLVPRTAPAEPVGLALWWWLTAVFLTLAAGCVVGTYSLAPSPASTRG